MTTLKTPTCFSNAYHRDLLSTDFAALATHMDACASSKGRFFKTRCAFESAHSIVRTRLITSASVFLMVVIALSFL